MNTRRHMPLSLVALVAGAVNAQQPAQEQTEVSAGLEEIIVTAQRRAEGLQRAALSVTAISGDEISNRGVTNVQQLTALAPALQVSPAGGPYSVFTLRGISNFAANAFADPAVAVNVGGVYLATPTAQHGLFYDLERVEVLKGPQGILYGRNATGGAINIIPRTPRFGELLGDAGVEVGNYDRVAFTGALNVPLGDTAALRVAGQTADRDGYFSDGTDDEKGRAARVSVAVRPTDPVSLLVTADYTKQRGRGAGATVRKLCGSEACFVDDPWTGLQDLPQHFEPTPPQSRSTFLDNEYFGVSAQLDWETDAGVLTLLPAYRESSIDYSSTQPGFQIIEWQEPSQFSFEARFASNDMGALRWVAGAYYLDTEMQARSNTENASGGTYSDQHIRTDGYTWAAFGQLTWSLTDTFRVTAGARYTYEEKTSDSRRWTVRPAIGPDPVIPTPPVGDPAFVVSQTKDWNATTWKVGIEWDVADDSLFYANVGTGFKAGGFFFGPPGADTYDPEEVTSYTIGTKNRFLDNRLQLNAEAFYLDYRDQQLSYVKLVPPTVVLVTENIGQVSTKGVEIEAKYLLTDATLIGLQAQWLDSTYDELSYTTIAPPGPTSRCTTTAGATGAIVNCSGLDALRSPEWVISASLEHGFVLANGARLVASLNSRYESSRELDIAYIPETHVGDHTRTDAALSYVDHRDTWSVTAFVNNIEDKAVINSATVNPAYGLNGVVATGLNPPRNYGIRFAVRF